MTSFRQQTFQKIRRNSNVVKNRFAVNWSSTIDVGDIQSDFATGMSKYDFGLGQNLGILRTLISMQLAPFNKNISEYDADD